MGNVATVVADNDPVTDELTPEIVEEVDTCKNICDKNIGDTPCCDGFCNPCVCDPCTCDTCECNTRVCDSRVSDAHECDTTDDFYRDWCSPCHGEKATEKTTGLTKNDLEQIKALFGSHFDRFTRTREFVAPEPSDAPISIVDQYPEIFSRKNMCTIDAVNDPDGTHVKLFNPELSQINSFTLDKDPAHKERGMWEMKVGGCSVPGISVTRNTRRLFGAQIKFDKKYVGHRKTFAGKFCENLLGVAKRYKGALLTDHYKNYPLWNVVLRDRDELHKFIAYLDSQNRRHRGTPFFDQKPILRLTFQSDPFLETLELEDIALINTMFQLVDMRDAKATTFFNDTIIEMSRILVDFKAGGSIQLGANAREQVLNTIEKFFHDFDRTDLLAKIAISTGSMFFAYIVWKKIVSPIAEEIFPGNIVTLLKSLFSEEKKSETKNA